MRDFFLSPKNLSKEYLNKNLTYLGGNSDVCWSTVDVLPGFIFDWSDVSAVNVDEISPILASSLSRPPSDELSCEAPFVGRLTGGFTFARRGRSLPVKVKRTFLIGYVAILEFLNFNIRHSTVVTEEY